MATEKTTQKEEKDEKKTVVATDDVVKGNDDKEKKENVEGNADENKNSESENATAVSATPAKKKKGKRSVFKGQAHIKCTYNNTVITITDMNGATLGWSSAGLLGFKGAKKSTPFAATKVAADVSEKVKKFGLKELMIFIKGVGGGREAAVRGLAGAGFDIFLIKDVTPVPHNGCRRRRPRRV